MQNPLHLQNLRNQPVAVVGGGRAGLAAAALLVDLGARPVLMDDASNETLEERLHHSDYDLDIPLQGGGLLLEHLAQMPLVLLSPGVPRKHPAIAPLIAAGQIELFNEVELAHAQMPGCKVAAVTGSNGKSTTVTLAGALLREADPNVFVGGNLGTPFCQGVLERGDIRHAILELSSYQLETIQRLPCDVGVITNLSPDHLDRYPDAEAYYDAKWRLVQLLSPTGALVLNAADNNLKVRLEGTNVNHLFNFNVSSEDRGVSLAGDWATLKGAHGERRLSLAHPHLIGQHNLENAAAALAVAHLFGLDEVQLTAGLRAYKGMAHRMERLGEVRGVLWINDSKATNVDAATTALQCFERGVHLCGRRGQGRFLQLLGGGRKEQLEGGVLFGDEAHSLETAFAGVCPAVCCANLDEAVGLAKGQAEAGDVFLLSPACASFDQYKSFEHRGEHFRSLFDRERTTG